MLARRLPVMSRFLNLPDDIHFEIAQIIASDPSFFSNPSRHFKLPPKLFTDCLSRPNQTLITLTLVCKLLQCIYAPFSTWRNLYIEVRTPRSAGFLGEEYELSPSLIRVLKYPETGKYAKELLIRYESLTLNSHSDLSDLADWKFGFVNEFTRGNLVGFNRFLANTPRLETVCCIPNDVCTWSEATGEILPAVPIQFFASLSSLASLQYLYLGPFHLPSKSLLPPLHQVRIRYPPGRKPFSGFIMNLKKSEYPLYIHQSDGSFRADKVNAWTAFKHFKLTAVTAGVRERPGTGRVYMKDLHGRVRPLADPAQGPVVGKGG
jgi:hypothetical protein